jgi:hypothetical protein
MFSTAEEVDRVIEVLPRLVEKLRGLTQKPGVARGSSLGTPVTDSRVTSNE